MFLRWLISLYLISTMVHAAPCPDWLNQTFKRLHSSESVNLCELYDGKPLVIVNTASHCGFTPQLKALETLSQQVQVIGFASDSFNQEAATEAEAAEVCYKNFGVTFTMLAPTAVKGPEANPVFAALAQQSKPPAWNFNKYLILPGQDGVAVTHFGSSTAPADIIKP